MSNSPYWEVSVLDGHYTASYSENVFINYTDKIKASRLIYSLLSTAYSFCYQSNGNSKVGSITSCRPYHPYHPCRPCHQRRRPYQHLFHRVAGQ